MSQFYYTDGKERFGPFTLEQLREKNLSGETLVWKEGMTDWMPARSVSDLNSLFETSDVFQPAATTTPYNPVIPDVRPKNWLVESILVTILCCLPLGIVGIINATKVDTLWNNGQRADAQKASQEAAKWVKIGFIIGLVVYGLYFLMMLFGLVAGIGSAM